MKKYIEKAIIFITIMLISGASILGTSIYFISAINLFLLISFIISKRNVNGFFIVFIIWWTIISYLSIIYDYGALTLNGFLGSIMIFIYSYFVLKIIGQSFFDRFEKVIYVLTIITLPIFLTSLIIPSFFDQLHSKFTFLTNSIFYEKKYIQRNYWYSFFYTYSGRGDYRNSGFMWEPGAFSMILIIAFIYTWLRDGIKIGKRQIVYFLGIISTFSTAGYIALGCLLIIATLQFKNAIVRFGLAIFVIGLIYFTYDLPFISDKIDNFITETKDLEGSTSDFNENKIEVNRLLSFVINFNQSLENPMGYGATNLSNNSQYSKFATVNGLGDILVKCGWLGLFAFLISLIKFTKLRYSKLNGKSYFLLPIPILIVFFSNPIINNPLLWIILFYPHIYKLNYLQSDKILTDFN